MIENVVQNIGGVAVFGLISICLFFGFFTGLLLWSVRLKKPYLNTMQSLPLEMEATPAPADRNGVPPGPAPLTSHL